MLVDRISIDTSGVSQEKIDAIYKGVAFKFHVLNEDGSLDISSTSALDDNLCEGLCNVLMSWTSKAQNYERDLSATNVSIHDA